MTSDAEKVTNASLQIHAATSEILEKALGRPPAYFEIAQAAAVTYGEALAFLVGSLDGDVNVVEPLDLITSAAFTGIAGPATLRTLGTA